MAVRPARLAAWAVAVALWLCGPAAAHLVPEPQFVRSDESSTLRLTGPNERRQPMTGLEVTLPSGLRIERALPSPGWMPAVEGATVTWRGGPLAYLVEATFELDVEVTAPPGQLTFETAQLYADGERVSWPVTLTVVPGAGHEEQNLGWAIAVGGVGLLVITGLALLAWRRRTRTLQER